MNTIEGWRQTLQRVKELDNVDREQAQSLRASLLSEVRAHSNLLERAEGFLLLHAVPASRKVDYEQTLNDLRFARLILSSNGRSDRLVDCLLLIQDALMNGGAIQAAFALAGELLRNHPTSAQQRGDISVMGLTLLAELRRFEEIDSWADRFVVPAIEGKTGAKPRTGWALDLLMVRGQQFSRAACVDLDCCLDLDPARAVDMTEAARRLEQAEWATTKATELAATRLDGELALAARMALAGMRGEGDLAADCFAKLNTAWAQMPGMYRCALIANWAVALVNLKEWQKAIGAYGEAITLARSSNSTLHLTALCHGYAMAATQLGRHEEASKYLSEFVRLHAAARRTSERWFTDLDDISAFGSRPLTVPLHPAQLIASRPPFLQRALSLMDAEGTGEALRVDAVAARVGVSRRTLELAMQRYLGQTPLRYLKESRMRRAHAMLRDSAKSPSEVARSLGYQNTRTFFRDFKARFGITPGQAGFPE